MFLHSVEVYMPGVDVRRYVVIISLLLSVGCVNCKVLSDGSETSGCYK